MPAGRLDNKTALITGGASGIGAAAARRFVAEGANVVITDRDTENGRALADELGRKTVFVEHDVTMEASWQHAIGAARNAFETLTTIVNSAGISVPGSIEDVTFEAFQQTIAINLHGVFLGCKYGLAAIKNQAGASIVNVGSTLGVKGGAPFASYCASKGGGRRLPKSAALHCAEQGYDVRVNCVVPGAIHTEMVERYIAAGIAQGSTREAVIEGFASAHPMNRLGRPDEPANAIVFLASDEATFTTGVDLPVDGGQLL